MTGCDLPTSAVGLLRDSAVCLASRRARLDPFSDTDLYYKQ